MVVWSSRWWWFITFPRWVNFQEMFKRSWSSTQEIFITMSMVMHILEKSQKAVCRKTLPLNCPSGRWKIIKLSGCWNVSPSVKPSFCPSEWWLPFFDSDSSVNKAPFFFGRFSMNPCPPRYASGLMDPQTTKHIVLVLVVMIESSGATPKSPNPVILAGWSWNHFRFGATAWAWEIPTKTTGRKRWVNGGMGWVKIGAWNRKDPFLGFNKKHVWFWGFASFRAKWCLAIPFENLVIWEQIPVWGFPLRAFSWGWKKCKCRYSVIWPRYWCCP